MKFGGICRPLCPFLHLMQFASALYQVDWLDFESTSLRKRALQENQARGKGFSSQLRD